MQKLILATISCVLLASLSAAPVFADDAPASGACAEWKSGTPIDMKSLDKLAKSTANDKPEKGQSYTKDQLVVLLGKYPVAAKEALANAKEKLPKTSDGQVDLKGVTLNGFKLTGLNLDNVDFKGAEMNGADLSGSTLRGASIYKAELEGANLNNADLSFVNAAKAKFAKASLCHTILTAADVEDADFLGAYLKGAKFDMTKNLPKVIYQNVEGLLHFGLPVPAFN